MFVATLVAVVDTAVDANSSVDVLKKVNIPAKWDNAKMEAFGDFTLQIDAYATQKLGFAEGTTAGNALYLAFGSDWAVFAPATP